MFYFFIYMMAMQLNLVASDISNLYQRRTGRLIAPVCSDFKDSYRSDNYVYTFDYQKKSRDYFHLVENIAHDIICKRLDFTQAKKYYNKLILLQIELHEAPSNQKINNKPIEYYDNYSLNCVQNVINKSKFR